MNKLTIDFETRSQVDLRKTGPYKYASDPSTDVMCLAAKFGNNDPVIWINPKFEHEELKTRKLPLVPLEDIIVMVQTCDVVEAHNAEFEYAMWNYCLARKFSIKKLDLNQLQCSAAMAATMGLPRALGDVALCLRVDQEKDKDGRALMLKMCKPRRVLKKDKEDYPERDFVKEPLWHEEPKQVRRLAEYCIQDVVTEHAISERMGDLVVKDFEWDVWRATARINETGIYVDLDSCKCLTDILKAHKFNLNAECERLTDGIRGTQTGALLAWCNERLSEPLPDLKAPTLRKVLENDDDLRRAGIEAGDSDYEPVGSEGDEPDSSPGNEDAPNGGSDEG